AVFILTILLFASLFLSNLFLIMNSSLDFENVAPHIKEIAKEKLTESNNFKNEYETKKLVCENENEVTFNLNSKEITVPCEIVKSGEKNSLEYVLKKEASNIYTEERNCELL